MPVIPTQISLENYPRYKYVAPAVNEMIALGMHSLIEYNDLILNDRMRPDRYKISSIDGLGGADIRDVRVPRPGAHGEIPYSALWGGRTLTLTGTMEAGSMGELTRMERDLRAAFGTLVESPMKFNWWDVEDDFSDPITSKAYWNTLEGSNISVPGNGTAKIAKGIVYHNKRSYIDQRVLVPISASQLAITGAAGIIFKAKSSETYMSAVLTQLGAEKITVRLAKKTPTTNLNLQENELTVGILGVRTFWLEVITRGDEIRVNVWNDNPDENPNAESLVAAPTKPWMSYTLGGVEAETFGYEKAGYTGLITETAEAAAYVFGGFFVEAIWPGDFIVNARPIAAPMIKQAVQTGVDRFRREFQLAVRASDPRFINSVVQQDRWTIGSTFPQRSYVVMNHGSWIALPAVTLYGEVKNPILTNVTTGVFTALQGTIANGETVIIDAQRNTLVNNRGENVFSLFSPESSFPAIVPGQNLFTYQAESIFAGIPAGQIIAKWHHSYI